MHVTTLQVALQMPRWEPTLSAENCISLHACKRACPKTLRAKKLMSARVAGQALGPGHSLGASSGETHRRHWVCIAAGLTTSRN